MTKLICRSTIACALSLIASAALAVQLEDTQEFAGYAGPAVFVVMMIVIGFFVYGMPPIDKRSTPLDRLFDVANDPIYSIAADALVTDCTRKMTDRKIGALIVMDGEQLIGIFTERDALGRVLAAGRDPCTTKVCEVMTSHPYCVTPEMTVGDAMAVVTNRRFRHLPVVANGKVRGVLSSGDLTHWMVKNHVGDVNELVAMAVRS